MKPWILGTRGSHLALAQSRMVAAALAAAHPGTSIEEKIIQTQGDQRLDLRLQSTTSLDKGLFTKELEVALSAGEIDLAVHSLKDLPTTLPAGFVLGAILPREDPADVLLTKSPTCPSPENPLRVVATSSPRRARQFQLQHPGCAIREIRGNVPTRLRKLRTDDGLDGLILALAGLKRLGLVDEAGNWNLGGEKFPEALAAELDGLFLHPLPEMLAAPGQGAVAVEVRQGDTNLRRALQALHCPITAACVVAERAVLRQLGGGCHLALGTLARPIHEGELHLAAVYFPDHAGEPATVLRGAVTGPIDRPEVLAGQLVAAWL